MSTVHLLSLELSNLVSQTKKRNSELRQAAENSLASLNGYASGSNEKLFFQDLAKDPAFISPFLLASSTRNAKYSATAIQCLHGLITLRAIQPAQLDAVIDALKEATHLGLDIQLKILQALPALAGEYGTELNSKQISNLLLLCSLLQSSTKAAVVVNTASATLQQLIISIFDRVVVEDNSNAPTQKTHEVPIGGETDEKILVSPIVYDALMIFYDLCSLTEKQKPTFLKFSQLSETFGLELLESILTNHSEIFLKHEEFAYVLRTRAVPLLLRAFSEKREFAVTVRVTRILYLLLRRELPVLKVECEVILSLLTHMLDADAAPYWKRLLCMEVFQGICAEFSLVQDIYEEYDNQEGRRPIIKCLVVEFEKICAEHPDIIGVGPASMPFLMNQDSAAPDDANDISNISGISVQTSAARVPSIDLLDKTDPPVSPPSYLHYLVLICINSLSEGIARRVVSSIQSSGDTRAPSSTKSGNSKRDLNLLSKLVEQCWTEILSCFQTFLHAAVEMDLYHALVRAAQKFGHSAGVLGISKPRDAALSLLAEFSILILDDSPKSTGASKLLSMETLVGTLGGTRDHQRGASNQPSTPGSQDTGTSGQVKVLSPRNILCCRAFLNLAVTLGPILGSSWIIVLETLQSCDSLLNGSGARRRRDVRGSRLFSQLGADFQAVDNAVKRLLESTKDYSPSAFSEMMAADFTVSRMCLNLDPPKQLVPFVTEKGDALFSVDFLAELVFANLSRMTDEDPLIWNQLTGYLLELIGSPTLSGEVRLRCAELFDSMVLSTTSESLAIAGTEAQQAVQRRTLSKLKVEIERVLATIVKDSDSVSATVASDIHILTIDHLNKILDQCGSKLVGTWDIVFEIIDTVFVRLSDDPADSARQKNERLTRLVKSGFESLTLICNDFLNTLPDHCLYSLVNTLFKFCDQTQDLNISFTAISFFWTVSDHLRSLLSKTGNTDFDAVLVSSVELTDLSGQGGTAAHIHALRIVALLRLSSIASDSRTQVRNGAIQILFRIFEAHGSDFPPNVWKTCQKIVAPQIMAIRPTVAEDNSIDSLWVETMSLILTGFSGLYSNFLQKYLAQQDFLEVWDSLITYFQSLIDTNNPLISVHVYNALQVVLSSIVKSKGGIEFPDAALESSWVFWIGQDIPKAPSDAKATQDALTVLVQLHSPLYVLSNEGMHDKLGETIDLLRKAATFGYLPQFYSDKDHLSPLQAATLERIEAIQLRSIDDVSKVLSLTSLLVCLPFNETKNPLPSDSKAKQPSFVSLSHNALCLLGRQLDKVTLPFEDLILAGTTDAIMRALLIPMDRKFDCPVISSPTQLWQVATTLFLRVAKDVIATSDHRDGAHKLWDLVLHGGISVLTSRSQSSLQFDASYEQFDIDSYRSYIDLIEIPAREQCGEEFWNTLIKGLFCSSFLYYRGQYTKAHFETGFASDELAALSGGPFYGSTEGYNRISRGKLAYVCLDELFRLASPGSGYAVHDVATGFLTWRAAQILHQYVADQPLRGLSPIPSLARVELLYFLKGLSSFIAAGDVSPPVQKLLPLLTRSISISTSDQEVLFAIQAILLVVDSKKLS